MTVLSPNAAEQGRSGRRDDTVVMVLDPCPIRGMVPQRAERREGSMDGTHRVRGLLAERKARRRHRAGPCGQGDGVPVHGDLVRVRRALRWAGLGALAALGSSCIEQPATEQARSVHSLFFVILALGAFVFVIVEGALVYSVIRFRKRDDEPA